MTRLAHGYRDLPPGVLETLEPDARQILPTEQENKFIRAINMRNHDAPYYNLRNVVRLIALAGAEVERSPAPRKRFAGAFRGATCYEAYLGRAWIRIRHLRGEHWRWKPWRRIDMGWDRT